MKEKPEKEQEERLKELWSTLDSGGDGQIDINGLKKGLKKMDHRGQDLEQQLARC